MRSLVLRCYRCHWDVVLFQEGLQLLILLSLTQASLLKCLILLHRLLHGILQESLALDLINLLLLLLNMLILLLIELRIKFDRFYLEPVDPLAQVSNAIIIHEGPICLIPFHLQKLKLFTNLEHLLLVRLLEVTLMRHERCSIVAIDAVG